jgi:hypothetical protein
LGVFATITVFDGPFTGNFEIPFDESLPIDSITRYAESAVSFQPRLVEDTNSPTQYMGYDASGNNNHLFIETEPGVNPLNSDSVTGDSSLDLGLATSVQFSQTTTLTDNFTYSTWVKNDNSSYGSTVLLANTVDDGAGNVTETNLITVDATGITVNLGSTTFFPYTMEVDKWTNITVTTENGVVKLFVDGVEVLPGSSTGTLAVPKSGILGIPAPQPNILIDGPTLLDMTVTPVLLSYIVNTGNLVIKLDFEEGYITEYVVTSQNNKFYLNGVESPVLTLNSNLTYTFFQNTSNTTPFLLSQDSNGGFPVASSDQLSVEYFVNNISVGKDSINYAINASTKNNNKVVLIADHVTNFYYHSSSTNKITTPTLVNVTQVEPKIHNLATTELSAQPNFGKVPNYTTNTAVNDFAMQFRATESNTLTFTDFEIDTNYMTLSSWVNIGSNYPTQDFNPLISQQGVFEYGINSNGKTYVKLLSFDPTASFISSIGEVVMDDSKVTINTITTGSTAFHLYALASTYPMAKAEVMSLMDAYATSNVVHYQNVSTVPTTIASINLTEVFDANNNIFDIESVNSVNVYVSGRAVNTPYVLGNLNEYFRYATTFENNKPRVLIESTSNLEVGSTVLTMDSATVFGSSSAIEKYYMFAFLQNDGFGTIGSDSNLLTNEKLQAFITNTDFVTDFDTLVADGTVYFDNTGVPLNEVKHITNATVTKAFTDVTTYTTGSAYVNMVDTNFYSFALVASDILDNVSTAFKRHYNLYKSLTDPQYIFNLNAIVVDETLKVSNTGTGNNGAIVTNFEIQFTVGEVYNFEWDFELLYPENPSYTSTYGPYGGFSVGENMTVKYDNTDYRDFTVTGNRGFYIDYYRKTVRYLVGPTGNTTNLPMYSSSYAGYIWNKHITLEVVSTTQIRLSAYETSDRVGTPLWTGIMGTSSYSGTAPTTDSILTIGLWQWNYGNFYMTMGNFYNNTISTVLTIVSAGNSGITISGQVSGSMTVSSLTVTYYALATTTELTNAQVISLVHANKTVGDALYDGLLITVKTQITETLTNVLIPNVLDTSSGSYVVKPSTTVNAAYVYLFATNGSVAYDNIVMKTIVASYDNPYIIIPIIYFDNVNNQGVIPAGATVFSSVTDIQTVYTPVVFASTVDLSDEIALNSFIQTHLTQIVGFSTNRYEVGTLGEMLITHVYLNLENPSDTTPVVEEGEYNGIIITKDTRGNVGVELILQVQVKNNVKMLSGITNIIDPYTTRNNTFYVRSDVGGYDAYMLVLYVSSDKKVIASLISKVNGDIYSNIELENDSSETNMNYSLTVAKVENGKRLVCCINCGSKYIHLHFLEIFGRNMTPYRAMINVTTSDYSNIILSNVNYSVIELGNPNKFGLVGMINQGHQYNFYLIYHVFETDGTFITHYRSIGGRSSIGVTSDKLYNVHKHGDDMDIVFSFGHNQYYDYRRNYTSGNIIKYENGSWLRRGTNSFYTENQFGSDHSAGEGGGIISNGKNILLFGINYSNDTTTNRLIHLGIYDSLTNTSIYDSLYWSNTTNKYFGGSYIKSLFEIPNNKDEIILLAPKTTGATTGHRLVKINISGRRLTEYEIPDSAIDSTSMRNRIMGYTNETHFVFINVKQGTLQFTHIPLFELNISQNTGGVATGIRSLSTLRTTITTTEFNIGDNTLQLTGEVIPSDTGTTTYKVLATTQPGLTPDQVRDLINDPANASAVLVDTVARYVTVGTVDNLLTPQSTGDTTTVVSSKNITTSYSLAKLSDNNTYTTGLAYAYIWSGNTPESEILYTFSDVKVITSFYIADGRRDTSFNGFDVYVGLTYESMYKIGTYSFTPTTVSDNAYPNSTTYTLDTPKYCKFVSFKNIKAYSSNGPTSPLAGISEIKIWGGSVTNNLSSLSNLSIPKVLDSTGAIYDSSAVNYAHVYLYGTDGTEAHDDIDTDLIEPRSYDKYIYDFSSMTLTTANASGMTESSFVALSDNYYMVGDRGNGVKKYIYKINETTPYQTITESLVINLAMTDLYFICAGGSAYKLYYRNTSDVWTEFHSKTTTVVGEYDSDIYDKTAVIQTSTGLDIITIVPGATQDDAPTVTTETITTVNGGCYGCRIYENTIVYADNATKILHVRERSDHTSPWVEVKTFANTMGNYGVSLYKNTLTRKDNPQTTALHVHERVNGTWNDTPSSTLILPGTGYGLTTSMFEDYIIVGNPGAGDAALYKRVNGVWQTTHTAVDYGSLHPWDVNIRNNIILIGRGTTVYKYEGTTTILPPELNPFVTISEVANIAENDLTLVSGSVFSSVASITKYYVVAFVTSAPSGSVVDTSTIDETTIASFITSLGSLTGTGYKTLLGATGTNMYYNEDGVAQYEVETIANVTVASAFTTLAPTATDGSEMVDITTTSGYSFDMYTIALDSIGNYGFGQQIDNTVYYYATSTTPLYLSGSSDTNIIITEIRLYADTSFTNIIPITIETNPIPGMTYITPEYAYNNDVVLEDDTNIFSINGLSNVKDTYLFKIKPINKNAVVRSSKIFYFRPLYAPAINLTYNGNDFIHEKLANSQTPVARSPATEETVAQQTIIF